MTKNTKLGFIRIAFAAVVGLPLFIATSAFAQNPSPAPATGGEATTQAVIVTGTNIPTAEEVTPSPLDTLSTEDVQRAGGTGDVLTILQKRNPDFVGGGNIGSSNANISSGGTQGGSVISIRGLPTLILFEGRRIADSAANSTGGAEFSDVRIFPTALISRIEVLKDGASALYGSDAVGGVVNIFLKDDYSGLEVGYRYGFTVEPGVAERKAWVIAGVGDDTSHIVAGFQYYEIDPLFLRERQYSRVPGGVTTTYFGSARQRATAVTDTNGRLLINAGLNSPFDAGVVPGSILASPNPPQYNAAGMNNTYHFATDAEVFAFDLSTQPTSTLDLSNTNAYASFTHKFCDNRLEAFGNFLFAHNHDESRLNAQPLSNGTGVIILGTMRVDPNTGALVAENRGAPAPANPFQESLDSNTLAGTHRLTIGNRYQTNPRIFVDDSTFYRFLGGLRSQINKDWFAEAATYYSQYKITFTNKNLVRADNLNALIEGQRDAMGNPIAGTFLDFFAGQPVGTGFGQVSQALFNTIFGSDIRAQSSFQRSFDFRITGFPLELPGGPLGVAAGVEYRVEGFKVTDSPEIFIGSVPIQEITTDRSVTSVNAEVRIPIVGSQQDITGIYNLEISLAGRYDIYEHLSTDSKVPKVTFRYQPIKDLTIRATYGNSFLAPTLYQLFGPTVQGFSDTITFNGVTQDQAQVLSGSNPNLVPSTAESWTAGLVYSPHFVPGLTITADFFHTLQQKIATTLGGQKILNSVNNLGSNSPFAGQVAFNNFPGQPGSVAITSPAAGQLDGNLAAVFYIDNLINIGAARVEGFDLSAHYNMELPPNWGQLELGINSVVFTESDIKSDPFSPYYNILGLVGPEFGVLGGANPDYKITALVEWRDKGFTLGFNANYIPEMKNAIGHDPEFEDQSTFETVDDYITVDGRISYEFHKAVPPPPAVMDAKDAKDGKAVAGVVPMAGCSIFDKMVDGLRLTVGCNNILDEDPRFVRGANSATSLSTYDPYGRFVYFEVAHKF